MGLAAVADTMELLERKNVTLTERDREFAARFAFRTGDRELTEKLAGELLDEGSDRDAVCRKYRALTGPASAGWIRQAENFLVSLELYRLREDQAVKDMAGLLSACGISMRECGAGRPEMAAAPENTRKGIIL